MYIKLALSPDDGLWYQGVYLPSLFNMAQLEHISDAEIHCLLAMVM